MFHPGFSRLPHEAVACCNPHPTTSFPGPSPPFPSGLIALQGFAHPSLDFPVLPWDPIPCLYIHVFLISAQSSILLLSQNIMQKVNFWVPERLTVLSACLHTWLMAPLGRALDCKGYVLCLWEACSLTSQSCCWERRSGTFGILCLCMRPVLSLWKVLGAFSPCSEISL